MRVVTAMRVVAAMSLVRSHECGSAGMTVVTALSVARGDECDVGDARGECDVLLPTIIMISPLAIVRRLVERGD